MCACLPVSSGFQECSGEGVKKAAECLGRQPNSNTWVMNEKIHIDLDGNLIPLHNQEYNYLAGKLGG